MHTFKNYCIQSGSHRIEDLARIAYSFISSFVPSSCKTEKMFSGSCLSLSLSLSLPSYQHNTLPLKGPLSEQYKRPRAVKHCELALQLFSFFQHTIVCIFMKIKRSYTCLHLVIIIIKGLHCFCCAKICH